MNGKTLSYDEAVELLRILQDMENTWKQLKQLSRNDAATELRDLQMGLLTSLIREMSDGLK